MILPYAAFCFFYCLPFSILRLPDLYHCFFLLPIPYIPPYSFFFSTLHRLTWSPSSSLLMLIGGIFLLFSCGNITAFILLLLQRLPLILALFLYSPWSPCKSLLMLIGGIFLSLPSYGSIAAFSSATTSVYSYLFLHSPGHPAAVDVDGRDLSLIHCPAAALLLSASCSTVSYLKSHLSSPLLCIVSPGHPAARCWCW